MLLVLNSPGGSSWINFYLEDLMDEGIVTLGFDLVASIAMDFLQVGEKRYSYPLTRFMIHTAILGDYNSTTGRIENGRTMTQEDEANCLYPGHPILAERSGKSEYEIRKMCKIETWMSPIEAKSVGFIDDIVNVPTELVGKLRQKPKGSIGFIKTKY